MIATSSNPSPQVNAAAWYAAGVTSEQFMRFVENAWLNYRFLPWWWQLALGVFWIAGPFLVWRLARRARRERRTKLPGFDVTRRPV